jgi:glycine/D-amino acid oxidase-like deaminating enzyme
MEETGESYVTMNREEVLGGVMSERFAGGVYLPSAFCVNPHLLTNQLVNRVDAGRNRVITGRIVESVTRDDNIFKITLKEEDTIFARKVVYCVGAYTPQLVPETEELFDLKRNICIATKRIGPNMFYSIPRASMSDGYKWFRSTNGRLLAGSVDKFNGEYDSPNVYKKLAKDFYETFPMIEAPIKFNWVSLIASTKSGPIVGPLPNRENEFVSAGYGNSSLSYAFLSGFIVADQIVNGGTDFPYADIFSPEGRLNVV